MAGAQCYECASSTNQPLVGVGGVHMFHDLKVYVTGSPESKAAVILISDVFGYEAPNLRKLADKVAASGYLVVVPDYFYGDPFVPDSCKIEEWIKNHMPAKGFENSAKVIDVLKSKGMTSIGAGGFCWGGKVVVELAKGEDIKAGVLLHPSVVTTDDIKVVKVPIAILGAEIDMVTPPELIKQFAATLSEKAEVDSFVNIYPGVSYGSTVRYDENDETAVKNAGAAHAKMLEWFEKYLKSGRKSNA